MGFVNGVPLRHLFFLVSCLLLALRAESTSSLIRRTAYMVHMDTSLMPKAFKDHHTWYSSTIDSLKFNNSGFENYQSSSPSLIYAYDHALSGFCALFSLQELQDLKKSVGFISAFKDSSFTLHTTHTPEFLSLNPSTGLWPASNYGEDVIVGVIDSGVWPESESFKDNGMSPKLPKKWKGMCVEGQSFNSSLCNAKLIGVSMNSARDTRGHGTYTASIAAGNYVAGANFFGYASGIAKGIAPRARLAVYKVSWNEGRYVYDAAAAIDQAIADGVDIISMSLSRPKNVPLQRDLLAKATFGAMANGVLVSSSAGNKGTDGEILQNGYPWVLTVTAGTTDRWYTGTLALENGLSITGWTLFIGNISNYRSLPLVYEKRRFMCDRALWEIPIGIIICNGYLPLSHQIQNIAQYRVWGAVFIANKSISSEIENTQHTIPCPCMIISSRDALALLEYVESTNSPLARMTFHQTVEGIKPAPIVSANALRGPSLLFPGILKPDVLAPGTLVLAAWPSKLKMEKGWRTFYSRYNILSGTSMACPHASGVAALLKGAHPEWSPSGIRSAIMTTANPLDNTHSPIKDNMNNLAASPLAMGAGQIQPNEALDPGLIYDATPQDYVNLLCSMNFTTEEISSFTRSRNHNCSTPSSDFNYPAFVVSRHDNVTPIVQKFQRTVTNVGEGAATYKARVTYPEGSTVEVLPGELIFRKKYEKQSYNVTISHKGNNDGEISFGALIWVEQNGNRAVRSPIVISPAIYPRE
ncbi:Subtilisin-like protease [Morella rubra]|uniref:Subtilisin-like protease n=1 Tax=Morella rubra TaxID=262757 RepID=A0A6A1UGZ7_9ROSI|nr:Subtilisin-like protease [Morella rubra]